MPDIDIDFCYERRQEVIDYVNRKYGSDRVCRITNVRNFGGKAGYQRCWACSEYVVCVRGQALLSKYRLNCI